MKKIFFSLFCAAFFLSGVAFGGVQKASAQDVSLTLSPANGTVASGGEFSVAVVLNTAGKEADGIDLANLNYPASVLQVKDIISGGIFDVTVVKKTEGVIRLVATVKPGAPGYKGTGTVLTINFRAIADSSSAEVKFDFSAGSTTDCNVAEHGTAKDILASVGNGSYKIGGSSTSIATPPASTTQSGQTNPGSVSQGEPATTGSIASVQPSASPSGQTKIGAFLQKNSLEWLPYLGIGILISLILVLVLRQFAKPSN